MEGDKQCGICGIFLTRLEHIIIFKDTMRCVCQECVVKACDASNCYICGKSSSYTFSSKTAIQNKEITGKIMTFYFPGCSKDCGSKNISESGKYLRKLFGEVDVNYEQKHSCKSCDRVSNDLLHCTGCKLAWYCNTACQKADWKVHKPFCQHPSKKPQPW